MRSKRTRQFRQLLRALPLEVRHQAYAAYRLFKTNPYHPSLHFKQVSKRRHLYSVRIGMSHRALGIREDSDLIVWVWVGSHEDYNNLISKQ